MLAVLPVVARRKTEGNRRQSSSPESFDMQIDNHLALAAFASPLSDFFAIAAEKIAALNRDWSPQRGAPVFTVEGKYTVRGWTDWTQGFQFGCQILQFDATEDERFLAMGRENTLRHMAPHLSHVGVHDHGFNTISTYGNLWRLLLEGRTGESDDARRFYELAIRVSGAVQAARWTTIHDGTGYIHSFNGPHSLFSDTIRSCRVLMLAHQLGHVLMGENDVRISLLRRAVEHISNTARYNVYYGRGRDAYDLRGRVAHEGIFNRTDGAYRCPSTQQGYSPFSTWTRGLAWILLGAAEELEMFATLDASEFDACGGKAAVEAVVMDMARATADYYIEHSAADGLVYWDTGAPGLANMPNWRSEPAVIDNPWEPVDSSASVIAAQGLLRLGRYLGACEDGARYWQAGLTIARRLLQPPYLSEDPGHQGLLLHSVYHRPNGWDHVPPGKQVPQGEASMWGDYHAMELAVYLRRLQDEKPYLAFFAPQPPQA